MNYPGIFYFRGLPKQNNSLEKPRLYRYLKNEEFNIVYKDFNYSQENPIENFNPVGYDLYIGNSFGSFFALYLGLKNQIPFILINPSIAPTKRIMEVYGIETDIYKQYEEELDELIKKNFKKTLNFIIISKNDEVVDNSIIINKLGLDKSKYILTDWQHEVPEEGFSLIKEKANELAIAYLVSGETND